MPKLRAAWLERLYHAVQEDGVQYLYPLEERWGEVAVFPELMNAYADLLLPLLRRVWCGEPPGGYVTGRTICLSCLLAGTTSCWNSSGTPAIGSGRINASAPRPWRDKDTMRRRSPLPTPAEGECPDLRSPTDRPLL
jgi:hypothetical protein